MGLFAKVKDILFEEEEITEPIKVVKEEKNEVPKKEVEDRPISRQIQVEKKVEPQPQVKPNINNDYDVMSERDLFKSENTFPFPDFDEEEFSNSVSRVKPKPSTNVLEYERKKRTEKRTDYGRFEKTEVRETVEKKRFKPSPIISPVYGILNEDYKIEDIKDKNEVAKENLDIDSVRKKAFEPALEILDEEPKTTYYEETVTVKVQEPEEEKQQKVKTIDELLEDTSDVTISLDDDKTPTMDTKEEYDEIDDELEELINQPKENVQKEEFDDDDTLENDLFDLIDSMYDDREDGEF